MTTRPETALTAREVTILELLASGVTTNAAIGERLKISHRTVDNYISRMIRQMDVKNRTELAVRWRLKKLVTMKVTR